MSDIDTVRLLVGDTDATAQLLSDQDITDLLSQRAVVTTAGTTNNVYATAADAADAIAAAFSRQFDFAEDGQSFSLSQKATNYRTLAQELRNRGGAQSVSLTSSVTAAVEDNILGGF